MSFYGFLGAGNIEYLAQNGVHIWDWWVAVQELFGKNRSGYSEINGDDWRWNEEEFIDRIATDHEFAEEWEIWVLFMVFNGENGRTGKVNYWPDSGAIDMIKTVRVASNIVSAWNVAEIDDIVQAGGLPPCHTMFQFNVRPGKNGEKTSWIWLTQRSADMLQGAV